MWCKLQKQIVQYSQNKDQKRLNFFGPFLTHPTTAKFSINVTSKSLSDTLIFASTNPQYYDILFVELHVLPMF